jgi:hypothetical protein
VAWETMSGPVCKVCVVQDSEGPIENFRAIANKAQQLIMKPTPKKFYEKYLENPFPNGVIFGGDLNANLKKDMLKYYLECKEVQMIEEMKKYVSEKEQSQIWEKVIEMYENDDNIKDSVISLIRTTNKEFQEKFSEKEKKLLVEHLEDTENVEDSLYIEKSENLKQKFRQNQSAIKFTVNDIPLKTLSKTINLGKKCTFDVKKQYKLTSESSFDKMKFEDSGNVARRGGLDEQKFYIGEILIERKTIERKTMYKVHMFNTTYLITQEDFDSFKIEITA